MDMRRKLALLSWKPDAANFSRVLAKNCGLLKKFHFVGRADKCKTNFVSKADSFGLLAAQSHVHDSCWSSALDFNFGDKCHASELQAHLRQIPVALNLTSVRMH